MRLSGGTRGARGGRGLRAASIALAGLACAPIVLAGPDCRPTTTDLALPSELVETSGVAVGRRDPSVLWTHNDDGSVLYAMDTTGSLLGEWPVQPRLRDWEDLAAAPCEVHGDCLYLADTGDNAERRSDGDAVIVRVAEPDPFAVAGASSPDPSSDVSVAVSGRPGLEGDVLPIRLPDGARDVEAVFVLPGERLHLVTKGRNHAVTVYRYPIPLRGDTVTLEEVQRLTDGPASLGNQVTGASATEDGRFVAVRTYQTIEFFAVDGDTLARIEDGVVNLRTLRESQGEAVALGPDGLVVLTSEGGPFGASPGMNLLRCALTT